ncbi:MAG: RagB/SusD family nutrient uptake outer membrane protein [Parapedobacter sp.]|nr:MAG: RagB/SusD family nutrient uptake outer membrane protein [Parapedobacter sp.]
MRYVNQNIAMKTSIKHHIRFAILGLLLFLGAGCEEFLERDHPTATTDELWWRSQNNLNDYLGSIYTNMLPTGALSGAQYRARVHMSGVTDEAVFRANFGTWHQFVTNLLTPADGYVTDMYRYNYAFIRDCSRILENYERVYVADAALKRRFAAEARALRAYAHLNLLLFFGPTPIIDRVVDFVDEDVKMLPRNTQDEVVQFISSELDLAAADLPDTYSEAELYRMSKGVCYALQVQLHLNVHNYEKVIEYFGKLRDLDKFHFHTGNYADIFTYAALTNQERILIQPRGNQGVMGRLGPASVPGGQATMSITSSLVDAYETLDGRTLDELSEAERQAFIENPIYNNNRDPRLAATVLLPGATLLPGVVYQPFDNNTGNTTRLGYNSANVSGYLVKKYLSEQDRTAQYGGGNLNFIVIRYTEMMLSYVEALVESGQITHPDVKAYLNQIRSRAGLPDYDETKYNTQEKLRELYRRERFVELALEGTRLFDIRRWKIGKEVLDGPVYGAYNPGAGSRVRVEDRLFLEERDYVWPIPLTEMNNNKAMVQNPNW